VSNSSSDPDNAIVRFLEGISRECTELGNDMATLGDFVSGSMVEAASPEVMFQLQAFDRLSQNAHAQARLLARIARFVLEDGEVSLAELSGLADDVPIHDARARLRQAINPLAAPPPSADDDIWFDDDPERKVAS
jgi:hypothetical protein